MEPSIDRFLYSRVSIKKNLTHLDPQSNSSNRWVFSNTKSLMGKLRLIRLIPPNHGHSNREIWDSSTTGVWGRPVSQASVGLCMPGSAVGLCISTSVWMLVAWQNRFSKRTGTRSKDGICDVSDKRQACNEPKHIYICIWLYICIYIIFYRCDYIQYHLHISIYMCIHVYIYTYIHIYI